MKVLHIISSLTSGGAEVYVRDLARQMVLEGHTVGIAYISVAEALDRSVEFEAEFKRQLAAVGIPFFELGHGCRRNPWKGGIRLREINAEFSPDIIHSHLYYALFFMMFCGSSSPAVYTHHNHRLGKGRFLYSLFKRFVDRFIGISRDCTNVLEAVGVKKLTTIYNGVSTERLKIKGEYKSARDSVKMLAVGRLTRQKNYPLLIRAMSNLYTRRPDLIGQVSLCIAGEGELRGELARLIDQLDLNECVELIGNREDIPQRLHGADLFVMSSDYEGLPIALLEAMMTGVPVVVTDVGGCRDVVEVCGAGIVVPPGSIYSFSEALEYVVDDPSYRIKCSQRAVRKSQQFRISEAADAHLELYEELLEMRRNEER